MIDYEAKYTEAREKLVQAAEAVVSMLEKDDGQPHIADRQYVAKSVRNVILDTASSDFVTTSLDKPGMISYSPEGVGPYDHKRRRCTRIGRWIGANSDLRGIAEHYRDGYASVLGSLLLDPNSVVRVVSGEEIVDLYKEEFGGHSCMTGECSRYVQVYADNPDRVQLAAYDDGKYTGRAVLWTADCGTKLMDRIYPGHGVAYQTMARWGQQNGYLVRDVIGATAETWRLWGGETFTVTLEWPFEESLPYMDSLRYGWWLNGQEDGTGATRLRLSNKETRENPMLLDSTTGDHDGHSGLFECVACSAKWWKIGMGTREFRKYDYRRDAEVEAGVRSYCRGCHSKTPACYYCGVVFPQDQMQPANQDGTLVVCDKCVVRERGSFCPGCKGFLIGTDYPHGEGTARSYYCWQCVAAARSATQRKREYGPLPWDGLLAAAVSPPPRGARYCGNSPGPDHLVAVAPEKGEAEDWKASEKTERFAKAYGWSAMSSTDATYTYSWVPVDMLHF